MLRGVSGVLPGYVAGGEVARVQFDHTQVKYRDLLTVFFGSHDPTSVNKQGADVGTQYRSVIFFSTPEQSRIASEFIGELNKSSRFGKPIVTDVEPLGRFTEAEEYHKDYYARNKEAMYCQLVINPKLEKVQKDFASLLSDENKRR